MKTLIKTVTIGQAVDALKDFKAFQFCSLKTKKSCDLVKKDRKTGLSTIGSSVTETAEFQGCGIGYVYKTSVNNRRKQAKHPEEFIPLSLPFGQYVQGSKTVIEHKGSYYLRVTYVQGASCKKHYTLNNQPSNYWAVESVLASKHLRKQHNGSARQEVVNTVKVMSIKLDNITEINFDGTKLIIQ
jgi:hypothetical protein